MPAARANDDGDEPQDYDAELEQYSKLWSGDRFPNDADYKDKVDRAREFWAQRTSDGRAEAITLLEKAAAMEPQQALAHGWLGVLYAETRQWKRCAASLDRAAGVDPKFVPPVSSHDPTYSLALERGICHAMAGNYEVAVGHFKQILSDGHDSPTASQRLGEAYMALGRLDDAISTFQSLERTRPYDPLLHFSLAVAYDRDEQIARSREHLAIALKHDPRLTTLSSHSRSYFPPEEEHYFLGLGYEADGQVLWALFHFREYLHAAAEGAWVGRARKHAALLVDHRAGVDMVRRGSADIDLARAKAAVATADDDLQKCLASMPRVLFRIRITVLADSGRRGGKARTSKTARLDDARTDSRGPRPGVKAMADITRIPEPESAELRPVVDCIEQVAAGIKMPRPAGASGSYASLEFRVIARDPD